MVFRRYTPRLAALFVLLITPILSSSAYAHSRAKDFFWVNAGIGAGTYEGAAGLSLSIQPSDPGYLFFSFRGVIVVDVPQLGFFSVIEEGDDIKDVALLVGYSTKRPQSLAYFSVATGISYVSGMSINSTFGLPVDVQLFFTPTPILGIGLQGFADFNKEKSFYGILFCLQLGILQ
jgi:hypothetical protein